MPPSIVVGMKAVMPTRDIQESRVNTMSCVDHRLTGAAAITQSPATSIVVSASHTRRYAMPRLVRPYRPTLTAELRHRVRAQLRCGEREILVDVGRLSNIDAAGIGQLVRVYNVTKAVKAEFRLANATSRVREVLQRVGLFDMMDAGNAHVMRR